MGYKVATIKDGKVKEIIAVIELDGKKFWAFVSLEKFKQLLGI